jgi:hypothetical protein
MMLFMKRGRMLTVLGLVGIAVGMLIGAGSLVSLMDRQPEGRQQRRFNACGIIAG